MKIYNTLSRKIEKFEPINPPGVLMYHCGPTVYWTQHIGNMRAMVLADLIVRTLECLDYKVKLTRNYTDVGHLTSDADEGEDKIEKEAIKENTTPEKIARKYIDVFERDIHLLNIADPDFKPRATENIDDVIKMIQKLIEKGFAYSTDLAIYFDVSKVKNYNKLSKQNLDEQIKGAGKAEVSDSNKKNPTDFALWFFKTGKHRNALQTWKSPFTSPLVQNGEGFPGWHIECSVLANKFLAKTIDIHMGGVEHIPVHHTNEIAQSEAANGVNFVNYWIHNEHLNVDGNKMSKSEGTGYSLQKIIDKGFGPISLRYFFLQAHYRSKQNFTWEALKASENALQKLYNFYLDLGEKSGKPDGIFVAKFKEFIGEDINIPKAVALMWDLIKDNKVKDEDKKATLLEFDKVFGLGLNNLKKDMSAQAEEIPDEIKKLAQERELARKNKDWTQADKIRNEIESLGYTLKDTKNGCEIHPFHRVKDTNSGSEIKKINSK